VWPELKVLSACRFEIRIAFLVGFGSARARQRRRTQIDGALDALGGRD